MPPPAPFQPASIALARAVGLAPFLTITHYTSDG